MSILRLFSIAVALSAGLICLHAIIGANKVWVVSPDKYRFEATDDRALGGASHSTLSLMKDGVALSCILKKKQFYDPYCGILIHLTDRISQGLDLTQIHTIRLTVDLFEPPAGHRHSAIRFYLRNFNPAYARRGDIFSMKYTGIEFQSEGHRVSVPMSSLQVMTWWLVKNRIPIRYTAPEFTNVTAMELSTGTQLPEGRYIMRVRGIDLVSSYFPRRLLWLALAVLWADVGITMAFVYYRKELQYSHQRQDALARLNRSLRSQNSEYADLAYHDPMTGALNRYGIRQWLKRQAGLVRKDQAELCVVYLDIDHFKQINDQLGHQAGDEVLREVKRVVTGWKHADDQFVRWGGEEFLLFYLGCSLERASARTEELRQIIMNHSWPHKQRLTCSFGVAQMRIELFTETLKRADAALYQAKKQGRNRVMMEEKR